MIKIKLMGHIKLIRNEWWQRQHQNQNGLGMSGITKVFFWVKKI